MLCPLLLVVFLSVEFSAANPCRQDWEFLDGSCYGFGEEALTWGDAQEMCRSNGARLAEIETSTENDFLKKLAKQKNKSGNWIGGTDIFHEGTWVWVSTGSLFHPFDDWASGQPDNAQGGHEDCLELAWRNDYQWNDNVCDAKRNFICEAAADVDGVVVG